MAYLQTARQYLKRGGKKLSKGLNVSRMCVCVCVRGAVNESRRSVIKKNCVFLSRYWWTLHIFVTETHTHRDEAKIRTSLSTSLVLFVMRVRLIFYVYIM